jgi:hypothetical protein
LFEQHLASASAALVQRFLDAAEYLDAARTNLLAFTAYSYRARAGRAAMSSGDARAPSSLVWSPSTARIA